MIAATSLVGCKKLRGETTKDISADILNSDINLEVIDDKLYANIGEVKNEEENNHLLMATYSGSSQELFVFTPEDCVDYAIYN